MDWFRALKKRVGRRGATLLFFAYLDFIYSWSIMVPARPDSKTLKFLEVLLPLWVWAALWAITGLVCLVSAFTKRDEWGFTSAIGIKVLWASVIILGDLAGKLERGFMSAILFLALAALVGLIAGWPEPSEREEPEDGT